MTFTREQLKELAQWEKQMRTAVDANYARGMSSRMAKRMHEILVAATGTNMVFNATCARCVTDLLRMVGVRYFADKEAAEKKSKRKKD